MRQNLIFSGSRLGGLTAAVSMLALAGCANTPGMRDLAGRGAARASADRRSTEEFVEAQRQLNATNAHELTDLNQIAAREQADTALIMDGWRFAGRGALVERESWVQQTGPAQIVALLDAQQPAPAALDDGAGAALAGASTAFAAMAKTPSPFDQAREFYGSAAAVYDALNALKAQAAKAGAAASPPHVRVAVK